MELPRTLFLRIRHRAVQQILNELSRSFGGLEESGFLVLATVQDEAKELRVSRLSEVVDCEIAVFVGNDTDDLIVQHMFLCRKLKITC